ncbi:unnamed protein product, partial [Cercopithifilaria johnstoni]
RDRDYGNWTIQVEQITVKHRTRWHYTNSDLLFR